MRLRMLLPIVAALALTGCFDQGPTSFAYDEPQVEENFKEECAEAAGNGQPAGYCDCVWEGLQAQSVSDEDVQRFEQAQETAGSDADINIPENIRNVMQNCRRDPQSKGASTRSGN